MELDRRLIRTEHQNFMPIGAWAKWITKELEVYSHFMLVLIIMHSISLGIQAEYSLIAAEKWRVIQGLTIFDLVCVTMYIYDIGLHLLDSVEDYTEDNWNILDVGLTLVVFEFISIMTPHWIDYCSYNHESVRCKLARPS